MDTFKPDNFPIFYTGFNETKLVIKSDGYIDCTPDPDDPTQQGAKQEYVKDCDINSILQAWALGYPINTTDEQRQFFATPEHFEFDLRDKLEKGRQVEESFKELPVHIQTRFNHNPFDLIDFLANEANYDEAVKLGIIDPKPPVIPKPVESQ